MPNEIILHQYDLSPFSEKVRVMLGIKNLSWRSCIQPVIMPKPELIPLTGGYRKIPVMQIGADIYCDSRSIIHELDRRHPSKGGIGAGLGDAIALWADRTLFGLTIPIIFGGSSFQVDEAFAKDREALSGAKFDPEAMKFAIPYARAALPAHLTAVENQLADGRKFLSGDTPDLSDASMYYILYFLDFSTGGQGPTFPQFKNIEAWRGRVRAIGHGSYTQIEREAALDIAKSNEPAAPLPSIENDASGLKLGQKVSVAADDYGRDPIVGELTSLGADHVTIRRNAPRVGDVAVHFPRVGFVVMPA